MLRVGDGDRPAPPRSHDGMRFRLALILCGSLIGHVSLFAFLRTEPEITASVSEDAITVEIVVGANSAAGTAYARSDVEAEQQSAMDVRQDEATQEKSIKEEPTPQPEAAMTPADEPITPVPTEVTPPERIVEETPEPKPLEPSSRPTSSTASAPANSIGRGRMVAGDANYQGLVAARLARFKRFPAEARRRREHGSAIVSFVIDDTGRVTSVRLVRGTGFAALDDEVQAMVRRASPFPSPPRGGEMTFTAPVRFYLN